MFRSALMIAALTLGACAPAFAPENVIEAIGDTRVTFASTNPDAGPLVFEFYADGTGLLALNEIAERGQTPLTWRVEGDQFCLTSETRPREDCITFELRGSTMVWDMSDGSVGVIEPL